MNKKGDIENSLEPSHMEKVELLSDDVQEIMGRIPHWLVRWGTTAIFSILILLIIGSSAFKYPDVITSNIVIYCENPSTSIIARTSGKIDFILVQNAKTVQQGEILAVLENSANYQHVMELKEKLEVFSTFFKSSQNPIIDNFEKDYSLGPLQSTFFAFQCQYRNYQDYLKTDLIGKKIQLIKQQCKYYITYQDKLKIQLEDQRESLMFMQRQFDKDSSLFAGNAIAMDDFKKQNYLQMKNSYQGLHVIMANTQIQMNHLNYKIIDLESQQMEQSQTNLQMLKEAYDVLKSAIAEWENQFVLISPINGKITFNRYWNKDQYLRKGDVVFTVVPAIPQKIFGRMRLPVSCSGKIRTGQKVLIRLDNYPHTEFGMVEGKLESISLLPEFTEQGACYTAEVSLLAGLVTNYGNKLTFNQELLGSAEIMTQELSLFNRLFNPLKSVLKKSRI